MENLKCKKCNKRLNNFFGDINLTLCLEHLKDYYRGKIVAHYQQIEVYRDWIKDIEDEINKNNI